ncbi:MAG TPA: metal-dependent transcriptional regulator [Terriglobales bacterium]|nr:metal-dependent transcriptional regulator [Terriglobales bacterium]
MSPQKTGGEGQSEPAEMYLETIYRLAENEGIARTTALAKSLGVSPGAVTNTLASLEAQGLVRRRAYKGVELTPKGRAVALRVLRRHRLAEQLLTKVLRMKWSDVHETACKLEHAMNGELTNAVERLLEHPKTCPHGNPIPDETGRIRMENSQPLSDFQPKDKAVLVRITEERSDMLRYLASLGLMPGAVLEIQEKAPFDGPMIVKVMGASYALGRNVASVVEARRI